MNVFHSGKGGRQGKCYWGWVRFAPGPAGRRKVRLCRDKAASERALRKLQVDADRDMLDPVGGERARQAERPIGEHVADYLEHLRMRNVDARHLQITGNMTRRLVTMAGWRLLRDISAESVEGVLRRLRDQGRTVSYGNKFLSRAKALVHWAVPDRLAVDPLVKLKRANERRAVKHRARRAATLEELSALLAAAPLDRRVKYALAVYSGLRRSEASQLQWGDLRLSATVPFIQLREETTKNAHADALPLHPYLVALLGVLPAGMPAGRVVGSMPDVKTLKKDLERAGVPFIVGGRRLDLHALRHTFRCLLDATGASEVSKRALMRHSVDNDVSMGYSHARLGELYDVICRLPVPVVESVALAVAVGAEVMPGSAGQMRHRSVASQCVAMHGIGAGRSGESLGRIGAGSTSRASVHSFASSGLRSGENRDSVRKTGPDTQAD